MVPFLFCPWPGCGFRIELLDFQLELMAESALYAQAMAEWGRDDFGLIGRCPGCRQFVLYGTQDKKLVEDPASLSLPILPDDWHLHAYIA
ncbi:MAG: hypothetical protein HY040_27285 [Planctomycetes bacterium]|nr:hypothetical protein [Planctomycetota bacterium]